MTLRLSDFTNLDGFEWFYAIIINGGCLVEQFYKHNLTVAKLHREIYLNGYVHGTNVLTFRFSHLVIFWQSSSRLRSPALQIP